MIKEDKRSKEIIKEKEDEFTMDDIEEIIEETKERLDKTGTSFFKKRNRIR